MQPDFQERNRNREGERRNDIGRGGRQLRHERTDKHRRIQK